MSRKVRFCFNLIMAATVLLLGQCRSVISANMWLNYMLTVEQPVTLVTCNRVTRRNGTCCSPTNSTDCIMCPDDPRVEFKVFVCFRRGYARGYNTDSHYCPLGGVEFTPNSVPGPWWALTPRPEAATLPREYPGSVQLYMKITAIMNSEATHLDDVWVYNHPIPADGTFRRITYQSFKQIAIVGVNVRVQCTNDATTADCSVPATIMPNPTQITTLAPSTTTTVSMHTQEPTDPDANKGTYYYYIANQTTGASPVLAECIGAGLAAGTCTATLLTLIIGMVTCCICKHSIKKARHLQENRAGDGETTHLENNAFTPLLNNQTQDSEQPHYEEIRCVYID